MGGISGGAPRGAARDDAVCATLLTLLLMTLLLMTLQLMTLLLRGLRHAASAAKERCTSTSKELRALRAVRARNRRTISSAAAAYIY